LNYWHAPSDIPSGEAKITDYGKSARPKPSPTFLSTFMSTLDRYVAGAISKPLLIFCPALLFLYANFTVIRYLDRVASGLLPAPVVLPLVLLNSAIALEILLPIGFHISVVVGLSRLYTDSEMTAFFACGITPMRIFRVVAVVSLLVALLMACLTLYVRPWANGLRYLLEHQVVAEFNFADLKPGHFYESPSGNRVLFFQAIDPDSRRMQQVFIQTISMHTVTIVSADEAFIGADDAVRRIFSLYSGALLRPFTESGRHIADGQPGACRQAGQSR
jgi:lipopolysaccharide export system permease protein